MNLFLRKKGTNCNNSFCLKLLVIKGTYVQSCQMEIFKIKSLSGDFCFQMPYKMNNFLQKPESEKEYSQNIILEMRNFLSNTMSYIELFPTNNYLV